MHLRRSAICLHPGPSLFWRETPGEDWQEQFLAETEVFIDLLKLCRIINQNDTFDVSVNTGFYGYFNSVLYHPN